MTSPVMVPTVLARCAKQVRVITRDGCIVTCQAATYPVFFLLIRLLRIHIHAPKQRAIPRGSLIVANHQSYLDAFFISYFLGPRNWLRLRPLRGPMTPNVFRKPLLRAPIALLGAYDVGETVLERAKSLLFTREMLQKGYAVLLFPAGALLKDEDAVFEFKPGMHWLLSDTQSVILVRFHGFAQGSLWKSLFSTRRCIEYSEPLKGSPSEKNALIRDFLTRAHSCAQSSSQALA